MKEITVTTTVMRHHPQLSRLVTIPLGTVAPWKLTGTVVIEGLINDTPLGRRSLKRWDDRECWWIDLPEPLCKKAKIEVGDEVKLVIRLASEELPQELGRIAREESESRCEVEKHDRSPAADVARGNLRRQNFRDTHQARGKVVSVIVLSSSFSLRARAS